MEKFKDIIFAYEKFDIGSNNLTNLAIRYLKNA